MKDDGTDSRQAAILKSAWAAFATYGFRKTSMDDIARGAGMSRPALYQHYRNKEDIFRSLAARHYDEAARAVAAALAGDGAVAVQLAAALAAQGGALAEAMLSSPHGLELLDAGSTVAADIVAAGEARLRAIYADWLARAAAAGRMTLPADPGAVADTITVALKGIKSAGTTFAVYRARVRILAAVIGAGLSGSR